MDIGRVMRERHWSNNYQHLFINWKAKEIEHSIFIKGCKDFHKCAVWHKDVRETCRSPNHAMQIWPQEPKREQNNTCVSKMSVPFLWFYTSYLHCSFSGSEHNKKKAWEETLIHLWPITLLFSVCLLWTGERKQLNMKSYRDIISWVSQLELHSKYIYKYNATLILIPVPTAASCLCLYSE